MNSTTQKQLIVVTGCAGGGKTTIGKELAKKLNFVYLDKDTLTSKFTDFILKQHNNKNDERESDYYTSFIMPLEYETCFSICNEILGNGSNVVISIPFISQIQDINKWHELQDKLNIDDSTNVKFIWIKHNIITEKHNIIKRNLPRDYYKLNHWNEYAETIKDVCPHPEYHALEIENNSYGDISHIIKQILLWLQL